MAELVWEKPRSTEQASKSGIKLQFVLAGVLILAAVAYLIFSGMSSGARYFLTVEEVVNSPAYLNKTVRISGAVLGDSIQYDSKTLKLDFTIVNIPNEYDNLAETLHLVVSDQSATRIKIHMDNEVIPDLLKHEAQAIVTGYMGDDGVFYANELLLKCPSRYEEAVPGKAIEDKGA